MYQIRMLIEMPLKVLLPNGILTFNEVCEEACRNTSIEPSIMKAAVAEYMKTVQA